MVIYLSRIIVNRWSSNWPNFVKYGGSVTPFLWHVHFNSPPQVEPLWLDTYRAFLEASSDATFDVTQKGTIRNRMSYEPYAYLCPPTNQPTLTNHPTTPQIQVSASRSLPWSYRTGWTPRCTALGSLMLTHEAQGLVAQGNPRVCCSRK